MAGWGQVNWLSRVLTRVCCSRNLSKLKVGPVSSHATVSHQIPASDQNCNVDLGVTHDGKTIVCFHHAAGIAFELTKTLSRPDTISDPVETHDLVLKSKLTGEILKDKQNSIIEELSKMFYTTKHRWYPTGQYHRRRRNRNPPKDR
ncbi:39S ribosomal protein L42, mitochondrial [Colossoma macropomum]|uniref:39S ribosomal protein L42, mitochondrial n=1 Tax=Colossoma macropomum TaxID=42526 RepID=UPI00186544CB|nr:39S ribosomal protein L42, mitochondrial [Colossoma macropomum]